MRLNLFDFRSPPKWSKADRDRKCDQAMIGVGWDFNPFGLHPVRVLPNIQPGVWRANGLPVVTENAYMKAWGDTVDARGWNLLHPDGSKREIWADRSQSLTAVDLTRVECVEAWVGAIVGHFGWASGIHIDYYTDLAWLFPTIDLTYWRGYNLGLAHAVALLRKQRPDWYIAGGQYHKTAITHYVDGLFHEEAPTHFGQTFAQLEADMDDHGGGREWTIELREPERYGPDYVRLTLDLIERRGCLLSWKRDAASLVGVPA